MSSKVKKYIWLLVAVLAYILVASIHFPGDLSPEGQKALALMVAAVIIWSTEVVPVGFASIALPMLTGVLGICGIGATLQNFVNSTLIFMISSQLIARAFVETGVGKRVALKISFIFGDKPAKVLLAFMLGLPANETVLPILLMIYTAQGSLTEPGALADVQAILLQNGWTGLTAACAVVFTVLHWPCSTTLLTVKKETGSMGWTALAALLPTLFGLILCALLAHL